MNSKKNVGKGVRPVFLPKKNSPGVNEIDIEFDWHLGVSFEVRKRSIVSMHENAKKIGIYKILEASSKSDDRIGINLSAFHLKNKSGYPVENIFQSSKVFAKGGPYRDLLSVKPKESKSDTRLKESGGLIKFTINGVDFPIEPRSLFYDWLYSTILFSETNKNIRNELFSLEYDAFSDIEFNPKKSFSCQARTLALCQSLYINDCYDDFLLNPVEFSRNNLIYSNNNLQDRLF